MMTLEKVLDEAMQLPLDQQRTLVNILHYCYAAKFNESNEPIDKKIGKLDFRKAAGLGEDIWKNIQVENYIQMERQAWD